ncbi:Kinesin-like protein KIF12 [Halotydeus destructor]|nr:Kinesin-like protein KIF12 [Halotydeus destructor]
MSNFDEGFGESDSAQHSGANSVSSVGDFVSNALKDNEFDNINVIVRVRPTIVGQRHQGPDKTRDPSSLFPAAGQIQITDPMSGTARSFTFNVVFEPEATQEELFEYSGIKRLINMALEGYAFAYLFEQIKMRRERGVYYVVTASYLEVYNEHVLDLLNPSTRSLSVRWSKDRGFYAENLFKVECEDIQDLEGVLEEGCKNRQVRSHQMNETSSRSHSLLTIVLASETQDPEDPQGYIRREGRLCLVDLAGSEKTKRTLSKGETLVEANNINRSLLVLMNCISALSSNKRRSGHIPYRDSTLTKLLADSLSGSGMTLMIACVSPLPQDASETINTLRYAMRAKNVKTNPIVRMDPRELLILSLKREVRLLRMENTYLRQQLNLGNGTLATNQPLNLYSSNGSSPAEGVVDRKVSLEEMEKDSLLKKYMQENEGLRGENAQLHLQRERLIHDHEIVCRENEKLIRRLQKEGVNVGSLSLETSLVDVNDLNDLEEPVKVETSNGHRRSVSSVRRPSIVLGLGEPEAVASSHANSHTNMKKVQARGSSSKPEANFSGLELRGTSAATRTRLRK